MRLVTWLTILVAFLVAGCRSSVDSQVEGKESPTVYDKVVSLSPSATDIAATVFMRTVVGRTESCTAALDAPVVMKGVKPDYEKIATIKPDCVVYDPDLFAESDLAKFKELGIPTFAMGGDTVDDFINMLFEFGRLSLSSQLASQYADRIQRERETAHATLPAGEPVKAAMIMPNTGYEHMIAGVDGFIADVLKSGGAEPVGPKGKVFTQLNAEWLIQTNPELIITAGAADKFLKDPRFKGLDAVKKSHVFGTNQDITLRRGAMIDKFIKRVNELVNVVRH